MNRVRVGLEAAFALAAVAALTVSVVMPVEASHSTVGKCPDRFVRISAGVDPDVDRNGDGVICIKNTPGRTITIDNNAKRGR